MTSKNFQPPTAMPPAPPPPNGQVVSGSVSVPPVTPAPAPAPSPKGVKAAAASTSTSSPAKRVCPVCKKKLGQGKKCPDHEIYCPGCGVVNEATEMKCHVCGTELNPPPPAAAAAAAPPAPPAPPTQTATQPPPPPPTAPVSGRNCPVCKKLLKVGELCEVHEFLCGACRAVNRRDNMYCHICGHDFQCGTTLPTAPKPSTPPAVPPPVTPPTSTPPSTPTLPPAVPPVTPTTPSTPTTVVVAPLPKDKGKDDEGKKQKALRIFRWIMLLLCLLALGGLLAKSCKGCGGEKTGKDLTSPMVSDPEPEPEPIMEPDPTETPAKASKPAPKVGPKKSPAKNKGKGKGKGKVSKRPAAPPEPEAHVYYYYEK